MFPNGLASQEGTIQKGNEVLSINGKSLKGATHNDALAILRQARDPRQAVIVTRKPALEAAPDLNSSTDSTNSASVASDVSGDSSKCPPARGRKPPGHVGCSVTRGPKNAWAAGDASVSTRARARAAGGLRGAGVTPRRARPGEEGVPNTVPVLPLQRRPRCTR